MGDAQNASVDLNGLSKEELECEQLRCEIRATRSGWFRLMQPYLVLLATAILSGLLIPSITRAWQDRQRELEVKTELVSELSDTVTAFVVAVQDVEIAEMRNQPYNGEAYYQAANEWEIGLSRISAKLTAYFPNTRLPDDWKVFAATVDEVYALTHTKVPAFRTKRLNVIRAQFEDSAINWDDLSTPVEELESLEAARPYESAWFSLKAAILERKDRIVEQMLSSTTSITSN